MNLQGRAPYRAYYEYFETNTNEITYVWNKGAVNISGEIAVNIL